MPFALTEMEATPCCVKAGGEPPSFSYQSRFDTTSRSPSWSRSAAVTDSPAMAMRRVGQLKPPVFSYQTTLLSNPEAERTSSSPSPSKSAAQASVHRLQSKVIDCSVQVCPSPPFSYQPTSSRLNAAK